jgi:hypothetical protein
MMTLTFFFAAGFDRFQLCAFAHAATNSVSDVRKVHCGAGKK